uniref:ORF2 n=1 Tax=Giant panda anellovirus TaxID=2016460 RepID=A0A220IGL1_9VIRU|nr:ORF2 [Giant panda anellovirus]
MTALTYSTFLSYTRVTGNGVEQIQSPPQTSTPVNNLRPVTSDIQYVLETLPQQEPTCSTPGISTLRALLQQTNLETSFDSLIQTILKNKKNSRRHRTKSTARHTTKKRTRTAAPRSPAVPPKKTRIRKIYTMHSRGESPETETSDTSSSEEFTDY